MDLDPKALDGLKAQLRGSLLVPGEAAYGEARSVWNAMIDRRPAAIVRCLGVADVVAGVRFARERNLLLTIKGGGHNISGLAVADGALTLDFSAMRGVFVDPAARTARVQPGCLLGDVDRETQLHGLAAVLGFVSNTGVAGLTLGGGFGYLTRRFGWTSDTLRSVSMVTAEGRIVEASEKTNADLFWGLRGGGGNFGVVTSFDFELFPVGPEIVGGAIAWSAEDAPAVVEMYRKTLAESPPEQGIVLGLRLAPPAPWLPKEIHGKPIVAIFVCDTGPVDAAERRMAAIRSVAKPVGDVVTRRSYVSQQALLDGTQPKGRRYYWKSEYLPFVGSDFLSTLLPHWQRIASPHSAILVFPISGTLGGLPAGHSAVGNRDAAAVVNIGGSWESAPDDSANIEWARAAWRDIRRFSTGGTYVNFLTEEESGDRIRDAYGANWERLSTIKAAWDPGNFFRANKNVAPK